MQTILTPPPLALYVHLPWCVRKCPYCDFNSHERKDDLPFDAYVDALLRDLDTDLPLAWGRVVHSVFFGGGTPSLFPPQAIDRFLQGASARLRFAPDIEITLESNPGTVEHGPFAGYRSAGVNRLSFGVQSFDDGCLQRLGRIHSSGDAERAVKAAQDAGFDNLNLDLMYALPGQTLAMAVDDIERALALQPAHISHYQLTLEPGTRFAARPPQDLPDIDTAWDMQEACQARLASAGFTQYEVSAYARPDRQCRHNLNYWQFGDYLGIGAGAHGKLTLAAEGRILRRWKIRHPALYLEKAGTAAAIGGDETLTATRLPFDFMLNALRLNAGVPLTLFEARTGLARTAIAATLADARARGLLDEDPDWLRPTELGRRFANDLIALFLD
ncbi:radical SAM family heme chaperone HemW [Thermomonas alba]|uniref:radical SAM family heme chaperone HemW n=1 Tax=Thermomonas alba TaxID=2888525 RepID=UPI003F716508